MLDCILRPAVEDSLAANRKRKLLPGIVEGIVFGQPFLRMRAVAQKFNAVRF